MMIDPKTLGLKTTYNNGVQALVTCPFHGGSGRSATFNLKTGKFYCFKCGKTSNANELAKKYGGKVTHTSKVVNNSRDYADFLFYINNPIAYNDSYLKQRKIPTWLIEKYDIKSNSDCVIFPCKDRLGNTSGVVVRYKKGKIRYKKHGFVDIWGLEEIDFNKPMIITEGIFGALRGKAQGYQTMTLTSAYRRIPECLLPTLKSLKVVFFYDDDEAGYMGFEKNKRILPHAKYIGGEADEEKWKDYLFD